MQEEQETQFWSLGQEDLLKEGMATHSSILAWKDDLVSYSPWGCKRVGHDLVTEQHTLQETEWEFKKLAHLSVEADKYEICMAGQQAGDSGKCWCFSF